MPQLVKLRCHDAWRAAANRHARPRSTRAGRAAVVHLGLPPAAQVLNLELEQERRLHDGAPAPRFCLDTAAAAFATTPAVLVLLVLQSYPLQ